MKNLVKKAKSNQWKSIVYGVYTFILAFYLFLKMPLSTYQLNKSTQFLVLDIMIIIIVLLMSMMIGLICYYTIADKNWEKVKTFKKELTLNRHFHHLRMIEKYIELGDKVNSELLFQQYINSKYWDQNSASFFDGAIRSKFYPKLEFKITHNGKEIA